MDVLGAQNIKFFGNIKFCSTVENKTKETEQKIITLNLDTKVEDNLSWNFSTNNKAMQIKIGQLYKVDFNVENYGLNQSSGKAIYNVEPETLKKYFVEIDCFCENSQSLQKTVCFYR